MQTGLNNEANVLQAGIGATSTVDQSGRNDFAYVDQLVGSDGSASTINQIGAGGDRSENTARVIQSGAMGESTITQGGFNSLAELEQSGDGNLSTILQTGTVDGFGNIADVLQSGADNVSTVTQVGSLNVASVTQTSDLNVSNVSQTGIGNTATVTQGM